MFYLEYFRIFYMFFLDLTPGRLKNICLKRIQKVLPETFENILSEMLKYTLPEIF